MDTLPVEPNYFIENTLLSSRWFNPNYLFNQGIIFFRKIYDIIVSNPDKITSIYSIISITLFFLAIFFIIIIFYTIVRIFEIRKKEKAHLAHEIAEYAHHQAEKEKKKQESAEISKNPRWLQVLTYLFSPHGSDWKLAIIEADSMLDGLLDQLGFQGDNLGDKLKKANQNNFRNLSFAWEIHTIRNKIAHESVDFQLSQHEAKRIIALYEQIFRDYGYI